MMIIEIHEILLIILCHFNIHLFISLYVKIICMKLYFFFVIYIGHLLLMNTFSE